MSDTHGTPDRTSGPASAEMVHEAYSFVCMRCGHGWEQSFEIAHHTDEHGHTSVVYYADARSVPSPLTRPSCPNCGGHLVRIMRAGRVSSARWERPAGTSYAARGPAGPAKAFPGPGSLFAPALADDEEPAGTRRPDDHDGDHDHDADHDHRHERDQRHHWVASLLALLHRGPRRDGAGHDRAA